MKTENIALTDHRWHFLDIIEAISLLFVIIYHTSTYYYNYNESANFLLYCRYYLTTVLSTCVPSFFFVNGYLFFHRSFNIKKHVKKTIKIVILTITWGIIELLVLMPIEGQFFSAKEFILNLISLRPVGWINHLWFMEALVFLYIFSPLLKKLYDTNKKYLLVFTIFCAIISSINFIITNGSGIIPDAVLNSKFIHAENCFYTTIRGFAFVYFCLGGLITEAENKIKNMKFMKAVSGVGIIINCMLLTILGVWLTKIQRSQWDVVYNGYDTIFTFINVICIYNLVRDYKGNIRIVKTISCNTLGIYYTHTILIHLTRKYIEEIPIFCTFFGNVIYAAGVLLSCLFIVLLMRKIPLVKKLVSL